MDPWSTALIAALDKVRPVVVQVDARTPNTDQMALGTGVILDYHHIITTAQIAALEDQITVKTADGRRRKATCIGIDPLYFLAVLKTEERLPFDPPTFAPEGTAPVGLHVFAVGYALGHEHTLSAGVIGASDRTVYRPGPTATGNLPVDGLIVTDGSIHPGNTGGPLVDLEGRVVGINGIPWQGGLSLAVQASVAARVASQIIDRGAAVHPWLGFSGEPDVIDKLWVDLFSLPVDRGVLVQFVADTGPGAAAGLQELDMVLSVGGRQPVTSLGVIRKLLSARQPGDQVPLKVLRHGELIDLALRVEEMPLLNELPDPEFIPDDEDEDDDDGDGDGDDDQEVH